MEKKVLIAGAGPSGLVLALWLTKTGVPIRIIDKAEKAGTTSRATVFHARNLECYHQMGIDKIALERSIGFKEMNVWVKGKRVARLPFGDAGGTISPYPYALIFQQDHHEAMLIEQLEQLGVRVERSTELLSFEDTGNGIRALIKKPSGETETDAALYLAGCDGAHSVVRHQIGAEFAGATYENIFYVADLQIKGPVADGKMHTALDHADFLAVFPMKGEGRVRLIGCIRQDVEDNATLNWEDVSKDIIKTLNIEVVEVKWFSTYRIHHRVANHFRKGNAFLAGDAGHIHSPVGGQGMNTGIGDAINLAWKLSAIIRQQAPLALLDTYEQERIAFARTLVSTTDRAFSFIDRRSRLAALVRTRVAPHLVSFLFLFPAMRRLVFKTISQTQIKYGNSTLSAGDKGSIGPGNRLPWVKFGEDTDNFAPLISMDWQIHCYGKPSKEVMEICRQRSIPLHAFTYNNTAKEAGLKEDAIYVIRPDGYIGYLALRSNAENLLVYLNNWGVATFD